MHGLAGEGAGGRLPISAFIITLNEAARLERTLAALWFCDQVVVVDSGSSDDTVALAKAAGAEVHVRAWQGYGLQKAHAETLCRHDWLLNVDADEVVTPALADALVALFAGGAPEPCAWRVAILNVYPGAARPRPLANDYCVVRFYHRSVARYRAHPLFDRVLVDDGVAIGRLRGALWHYPLLSWAHFVEKENRYTSYQAKAARLRPRWVLLLRLGVEFPFQFMKFYLIRRHITGGWQGFVFATTAAYARFLRIAKLLERTEAQAIAPEK
ncbi:MAG: glycosyltransferase family 2 protein [Pseudomonadota bacterium]